MDDWARKLPSSPARPPHFIPGVESCGDCPLHSISSGSSMLLPVFHGRTVRRNRIDGVAKTASQDDKARLSFRGPFCDESLAGFSPLGYTSGNPAAT